MSLKSNNFIDTIFFWFQEKFFLWRKSILLWLLPLAFTPSLTFVQGHFWRKTGAPKTFLHFSWFTFQFPKSDKKHPFLLRAVPPIHSLLITSKFWFKYLSIIPLPVVFQHWNVARLVPVKSFLIFPIDSAPFLNEYFHSSCDFRLPQVSVLPSQWQLQVQGDKKNYDVVVKKGDKQFTVWHRYIHVILRHVLLYGCLWVFDFAQVEFDDGSKLDISDNFILSNPVINASIDGKEEIFQLVRKHLDHFKIQYCGTVVRSRYLSLDEHRILSIILFSQCLDHLHDTLSNIWF